MSEAAERDAVRRANLAASRTPEPGEDHNADTCDKPICVETRRIIAKRAEERVSAES